MPGPARQRRTTRPRSVTVLLAATVGLLVTTVSPAGAAVDVIVLPGASSAEGIAKGESDTSYADDLFRGDIFRGDLGDRTAELFIDAPDGRGAVGMQADLRHDLLFVAGGFTGQAYVYDLDSGATGRDLSVSFAARGDQRRHRHAERRLVHRQPPSRALLRIGRPRRRAG